MNAGIQRKLEAMGSGACLALCYCYICHCTDIEAIDIILEAMERNIVSENDCYVKDGIAFVKLVMEKIGAEIETVNIKKYNTRPKDVTTIATFHNSRTGYSHFAVEDANGNVIFDPLGNSVTVREGKEVEWRTIS